MRKYSNKYKLMISTANAFLRTRARAAMSLLYRQVFGDFSSSTRGIGHLRIVYIKLLSTTYITHPA